jgi:hypothetical protein
VSQVKVIGAGLGRTGKLGFGPCYHMFEVLSNPGHAHEHRSETCDVTMRFAAPASGQAHGCAGRRSRFLQPW